MTAKANIRPALCLLQLLSIQTVLTAPGSISRAAAAEQPTAIFHAFNQSFSDVKDFVCTLKEQGYSHVQISPAQKSLAGSKWWNRYQPVNYQVIDGLGTAADLSALIKKAHSCKIKVIADVVFNHMANLDGKEETEDVSKFPGLEPSDFKMSSQDPSRRSCEIGENNGYNDGNQNAEVNCWLGGLPDLNFTDRVKKLQKEHIKMLLAMGIDGFRFDAAKHMPKPVLQEYINFIDNESQGKTWNYLEVIEDQDTKAEDFNSIAAVTDFRLYNSMRQIFELGGDMRSLPATAVNDSRSVTFGANHDTIKALNDKAINPYTDITDSYLATAYVLARQAGTPLVLNEQNFMAPYVKHGVKFRQLMIERGKEGKNVKEAILKTIDSNTAAMMQRGSQGMFVVNKSANTLDVPSLDMTLTDLEGCYRELRNNFTIAIERKQNQKFITRWGTWKRGGLDVKGRDALYFVQVPFGECQTP